MTRKSKRNNKRNNKRSSQDIVTVPARALLQGNLASGLAQISLQPTNLNAVSGSADSYEFYRISRLRYRLFPSSISGIQVAAYIAGAVDNPPTTTSDLAITRHACLLGDEVTVPSSWRNVPKTALASYMSWYKTVVGSPAPDTELQGSIYLAGSGTDGYTLEIEATYQFRSLVATSATPKERGFTEMRKQREYMLRVMGLSPAAPAPASNPTSK